MDILSQFLDLIIANYVNKEKLDIYQRERGRERERDSERKKEID
jgi:hypothetical protein